MVVADKVQVFSFDRNNFKNKLTLTSFLHGSDSVYVLSHVKTNNKLPPKYVELDNARPTDNDTYAKS